MASSRSTPPFIKLSPSALVVSTNVSTSGDKALYKAKENGRNQVQLG